MSALTKFIYQLSTLQEAEKSKAVQKLITDSTPDYDFFLLVGLSVLMTTFGLLIDSVAIVIGSMLIAPLLSPILSLSLGIVMSDAKLIVRSFGTVLHATTLGILISAVATFLFAQNQEVLTGEVLQRANPSLLYFMVALIAGFAVAYSMIRPDLSVTFPGIAVAVALIPPVGVVGVALARFNWELALNSFLLFLINIVGIVFASMFVFSLMDLYGKKKVAEKTIQKEDKRLEKEKVKAEEFKEENTSKPAVNS